MAQLAAESAPAGLILQSTFSSLRDVADVHYPRLSWLVPRAKLNTVSVITHYEGPLLASHGNQDTVVPFTLGKKLFDAASKPKTFFEIDGADHNDWLTDDYVKELDRFIDRIARDKKPRLR